MEKNYAPTKQMQLTTETEGRESELISPKFYVNFLDFYNIK